MAATLAAVVTVTVATGAHAATRFAGPGGTGTEPCTDRANPCSVFTAADRSSAVRTGDVVVLAPGWYSDTAGDLGPAGSVFLEEGIVVRGAADQPRPVITLDSAPATGALVVPLSSFASHLEILSATAPTNITIAGAGIDLVVRNSKAFGTAACTHAGGAILDSACVSTGAGTAALGRDTTAPSAGLARLESVTAVATGAGSAGLSYTITALADLDVIARNVLAEGTAVDVAVAGLSPTPNQPNTGARIRIELERSSYATVRTLTDGGGGLASVTAPGTRGNITASPRLAADGFHQLPGSPTIDAGSADPFTAATDIDGHARVLGAALDIGAEEIVPTDTVLKCTPEALKVGESSSCTATVTAASPDLPSPTGTVALSVEGGSGLFEGGPRCDLAPAGAGAAACSVTYRPSVARTHAHAITARYPGAGGHEASQAEMVLDVSAIRFAAPGGAGAEPCEDPDNPCSLFRAADRDGGVRAGDEVVLAPGVYSVAAGDLGPDGSVRLEPGIELGGAAGQPRPVIRRDTAGPAPLLVDAGDDVSRLEVVSTAGPTGLVVRGGVVADAIVRTSAAGSVACRHDGGAIRDSVCLSSGGRGTAVGASGVQLESPRTVTLRSVTAVSSGAESFGLRYVAQSVQQSPTLTVEATGVIARGTAKDVVAEELGATSVEIELDHSSYATTAALTDAGGGSAAVTPARSGTNVAAALLAADGFHQLPGSPTIDQDRSEGLAAADIDRQARPRGLAGDIGADEIATSATALGCAPTALAANGSTAVCTVTVTDAFARPLPPEGVVALSTDGAGAFEDDGRCELIAESASESTCQLTYTPTGAGEHRLSAAYAGGSHDSSTGSATVRVNGPPDLPPGPPPSSPAASAPAAAPRDVGGAVQPPQTKLGKRPRARTAVRSAVFTFSSDQAGSSFECKLDRRPFKRCRSPFRSAMKPGRHSFQVRAVGDRGAADPTPASFSWRVVRATR